MGTMIAPPPAEPIYLSGAADPVFANFHRPAPGAERDTAVLLCPPFGWDEVCSYRSRREWAQHLAQAGYASIRLGFPGTGDSGGGPRDPDRLEAWTAAVTASGGWLRAATGANRIVAIGIGLGGLVAYRAAARTGPIDDLVMWATPARGRSLVRQLRAFSRLEAALFFEELEPPASLAADELEAGGFLLSAQTVRELDSLDLTSMPLPSASSRRILLLERDGIPVDTGLRQALERLGVGLTTAPGDGYAEMTSHPQQARAPLQVIELVTRWLDQASSSAAPLVDAAAHAVGGASGRASMLLGEGAAVWETPFTVHQPFGELTGILVEPLAAREPGLCAVLLNAGAVRRIGPSRMWVEAARRWAACGVTTLRLDVEGVGDADGDAAPYADDAGLYVPELIPQVLATLDALQERGLGERFVLAGLCAGAYWSFHAALRDPRVSAAIMVNPRALVWDPALTPARDFRALFFDAPSWAKIRRSYSSARMRALALWMLSAPKRLMARMRSPEARAAAAGTEIDELLDQLRASDKRALLLFSENEPLDQELVRSGQMAALERAPNVTVQRIRVRDHTLRPNWAQGQAHKALDLALERELRVTGTSEPAARQSSRI